MRALALAVLVVAVACTPVAAPTAAGTTKAVGTEPPAVQPEAPTVGPEAPATRPNLLAQLVIDDHPDATGYQRDLFMPGGHWQDPDHNHCDAREDALRAQSTPPVTSPGCDTTGGRWPLVYVAGITANAGQVDVDHIVPLRDTWRSGARNWLADQRINYAADPKVLWVVDASANRSKGDRDPSLWRPAETAVWCTYATRWTSIKLSYHLTATTAERDALGQMLEEC